jgi:hypothetical protein
MRQRLLQLLIIAALVVIATGCYVYARPAPGIAVAVGPPVYPVEGAIVAPGPGFVWVGGYYNWSIATKSYAWIPGRWMRPPFRGARWYGPRWERGTYYRGVWR